MCLIHVTRTASPRSRDVVSDIFKKTKSKSLSDYYQRFHPQRFVLQASVSLFAEANLFWLSLVNQVPYTPRHTCVETKYLGNETLEPFHRVLLPTMPRAARSLRPAIIYMYM